MKRVLIVFGTRPEAIKVAPVIREMQKLSDDFQVITCNTAQHRQLLDPVLELFDIRPYFDLDLMKDNQDLFDVTTRVLLQMRKVLREVVPDLVLVQGDTTTTFATALASFYERIDVGHIEAGLRTGKIYSPFPEEVNRQCVSRIARYHFVPTVINKTNLLKEGVAENDIIVTGNTVVDSLNFILARKRPDTSLAELISIAADSLTGRRIILVTGHRRENFGAGFESICHALRGIAEKYADVAIIYPVHLNPNVRKPVNDIIADVGNIHLIEPVDYQVFSILLNTAYLVLTDSGGVQEEAPSLGKPTLVMRDTTERPEAVTAGTVKLVGTDRDAIMDGVDELLTNHSIYLEMAKAMNPYGDGKAAERICQYLKCGACTQLTI